MICSYPPRLAFFVLLVNLLGWGLPAAAQGEFNNWYFGQKAGVAFTPGSAQAVTDGQLVSGESSAAISTAQGSLLFYTNGIYAWNRQHRLMANGKDLGAYKDSTKTEQLPNSATQGVVVVPAPGSSTEYYVFTVDAAEHGLRDGLRYSVVDLARQGGLGEVVRKAVPVPVPGGGQLTEKLLAVRHANQRDIWLVVHGWNNNLFLSYLLTSSGLSAPVLSAGGTIHQGGDNGRQDYNAIGYLKASQDGRQLAVAQFNGSLEVFDFNYGTGVVSSPRLLDTYVNSRSFMNPGFYGVEFSPNGRLLYLSYGPVLRQFDLQTGTRTDIAAAGFLGALQLGPDQRIYAAQYRGQLGVIASPDAPGLACGYRDNALTWRLPQSCLLGLPNVLVRPPVPGTVLVTFGLLGTNVCVGETTSLSASVYPFIPDAVFSWDFGDPTSPDNTATGPAVQHRYARAGTYRATMTMRQVSGVVHAYAQSVLIRPLPVAKLSAGPAGVPCSATGSLLTVVPAQPAGTAFRWQDGSTATQYRATASGLYWVEVTPPQQCPVRDSLRLVVFPSPAVSLGPDQYICAEQSLRLTAGPHPPGTAYRWQDGSTGAQLRVDRPGRYAVTVTTPAGCAASSAVQVRFGDDCPFEVPNIITPNGDQQNETFVLKGLEARAWDVQIFNRWGRLIYEQAHYDNRWNATGQPPGLYYYLLMHPKSGRRIKGWVEVNR